MSDLIYLFIFFLTIGIIHFGYTTHAHQLMIRTNFHFGYTTRLLGDLQLNLVEVA